MFRTLAVSLLSLLLCASVAFAEKPLVVASDPTFPPNEMLNKDKEIVGFSIDYIKAVGKEAGFDVQVKNIAWDGIFAGVAAGKYEIVASGVSITPERQKAFDLSDPYYDVYPTIITMAGSSIKKPSDLNGKKVGGQIGNSSLIALQKANTGCTIREYDDVGLAIEDMVKGRIDATCLDSPVALYYMNKKKEYANKLQVAMTIGEPEHYGFVVKKGNKELLAKLNKGIQLVEQNGAYDRLLKEYMGGK